MVPSSGSKLADWATMQKSSEVRPLGNDEKKVVSAHRTPDLMFKHAEEARVVASRSSSQVLVAQRICQA